MLQLTVQRVSSFKGMLTEEFWLIVFVLHESIKSIKFYNKTPEIFTSGVQHYTLHF
jgi:hypothetical protein